MLGNTNHFVGPLIPMKRHRVKGIGRDLLKMKANGTLSWKIADNYGQVHLLVIKNALIVPGMPYFPLFNQYWIQQAQDNRPIRRGTRCATYTDDCKIYWKKRQFTRTVTWDPYTNVAKIQYGTGSVLHHVFTTTLEEALCTEAKERFFLCYTHVCLY